MGKVAYLVKSLSHDRQFELLREVAQSSGMSIEAVKWRDDELINWDEFVAVLFIAAWDYVGYYDLFFERMQELSVRFPHLHFFNPLNVVRWNSDKAYLKELQDLGVQTIPSEFVSLSQTYKREDGDGVGYVEWDVAQVVQKIEILRERRSIDEMRGCEIDYETFVIKPRIGANGGRTSKISFSRVRELAHLQALQTAGKPAPPSQLVEVLKSWPLDSDILIQPFLPGVQAHGEVSVVFFNGKVSHCARKVPASDNFLTQFDHGANIMSHPLPHEAELEVAQRTLQIVHSKLLPRLLACEATTLLYSRVDLLQVGDGQFRVMEIELIEPWFYLDQHHIGPRQGAELFTSHLQARISKNLNGYVTKPNELTQQKQS